MVIEAHKALKKRRKLRKLSLEELRHYKESNKVSPTSPPTLNDVNIFSFLSKKKEGYNDLIKQIGNKKDGSKTVSNSKEIGRSKSCNDAPMFNGHTILSLDRSPRQKRRYSFSDRVTVAFSKSKNYLLGSDNGLLLKEDQVEGDLELNHDQMFENQLDKDVNLENGGERECVSVGHRAWDSKEYNSLMFQNANITFIDEENFLSNNSEELEEDEEDDDDSKAKLSITTCDENIETNSKEEQSSESEGSVFTSDGSEHSHSYEKLVEEYAKEENTDSWHLKATHVKATHVKHCNVKRLRGKLHCTLKGSDHEKSRSNFKSNSWARVLCLAESELQSTWHITPGVFNDWSVSLFYTVWKTISNILLSCPKKQVFLCFFYFHMGFLLISCIFVYL